MWFKVRGVLPLALLVWSVPEPVVAAPRQWLGGSASVPIPASPLPTSLVLESAEITLRGEDLGRLRSGERWKVETRYRIRVPEGPPLETGIAFPYLNVYGPALDLNLPRGQEAPGPGRPLVFGFAASRNGTPLAVTEVPLKPTGKLPGQGFEFGYVWEGRWETGAYTVAADFVMGVGTHETGAREVEFALRPVSLWRGGGTRLRVEVLPGEPIRSCAEVAREDGEHYGVLSARSPEPGPWKRQGQGSGVRLTWELSRFGGERDLRLCFIGASVYRANLLRHLVLRQTSFFQGRNREELRRLRHTVYAAHGRKFRDNDLHREFSGLWWYEADPGFHVSRLSEGERELVKFLLKQERLSER